MNTFYIIGCVMGSILLLIVLGAKYYEKQMKKEGDLNTQVTR